MGIFSEIGPVSCFISRTAIPEDMEYEATSNPACYKGKEDDVVLEAGDKIRVKVVGTRVDAKEIFVIGTLKDDYLGCTG